MEAAIIQGIIVGLILSVPVSPIFFLIISTSLEKGFRQALIFEAGIVTSDILCIVLIYFGLANVINSAGFILTIYLLGGLCLIYIGLTSLRKKIKLDYNHVDNNPSKNLQMYFKGFFLNLSNPAVIIFWIGAVGIALAQYNEIYLGVLYYFLFAIVTVLFFDILKIWLASSIRHYLKIHHIKFMSNLAGVAMGSFGIYLVCKGVYMLYTKGLD